MSGAIINDAGQTVIRCGFCSKLCDSEEITPVTINGVVWNACSFCVNYATAATVAQIVANVHPNNIEVAYGEVISWEWLTDNIDYVP